MPNTAAHPTAPFAGYHECAPLTPQHRAKLASDNNQTFAGWHRFQTQTGDDQLGTVNHGSFEVFYDGPRSPQEGEGWYWWPCFPGCVPDGEANGPFPTSEGAYLDAIGE